MAARNSASETAATRAAPARISASAVGSGLRTAMPSASVRPASVRRGAPAANESR